MGKLGTFFYKLAGAENCVVESGPGTATRQILLVGSPNVGKSALFNQITGRYVTVSNYPGTTVEVSRGTSRFFEADTEIIDTPGMYSLMPISDEERVGRDILLDRTPLAVIHVIDAKAIHRMLPLTLQIIDADLPAVLAVNMSDEAQAAGIRIDYQKLEDLLGIPVVPTVATSGKGVNVLVERVKSLSSDKKRQKVRLDYGGVLEQSVAGIASRLGDGPGIGPRGRALLLLEGDHKVIADVVAARGKAFGEEMSQIVFDTCSRLGGTVHAHAAVAVKAKVDEILAQAAVFPPRQAQGFRERLNHLLMNPLTGFPILLLVLFLGLYEFVGVFGAGFLVGQIENNVFGNWINPWIEGVAHRIPWQVLHDLVAGDYGIVTLGLRYAIAIVLPIVGTFFLAFSILEDSGYLPRLAMLVDGIFKRIGLSGRAVIPMVLGFGCDTMATMVTRTLETKRERIIATFLLALAIPCSAQIGVIMGLLAGHPAALLTWAGIILAVFLTAGVIAARFLPGERPSFYMELPPLRLPRLTNVLVKTYSRMVWYFKEILPLFIIASVLIWLGNLTGAFPFAVDCLKPVVHALGLPPDAAVAFLFSFFRRDYGVAGLYDLRGGLTGNQLMVAAVTLTLFLPCIAQFLVMAKERGWKMTLTVSAFIAIFAFVMGFLVNLGLTALKVQL